ncbi:MAG: undecaprenyl-diphosphate phosphatase, partial [Solibacillus isronensis]
MENFDLILVLKHFIIGIVQGLTEPIPVSSSGHVMIVSEILGMGEQGFTFAILTNTASLIAIMFIYREDIIRLITGFLLFIKTRNARYR